MDDAEGEWVVLFEATVVDERGNFGLNVLEGLEVAEFYNLTDDPGQLNNLLPANIEIDDNETPSEVGLAAITDPIMRQRVTDMVNQFFSYWEKDDPRTSAAVDYSIAANQTPIPGFRQLGDTNGDGLVDIDDLNAVRNNFGAAGAADGSLAGDAFPFDGLVNIDDLNAVRNNFGVGAAAPEPSALAMTLLALALFATRGPRRTAKRVD
jgi:hypothetical protein